MLIYSKLHEKNHVITYTNIIKMLSTHILHNSILIIKQVSPYKGSILFMSQRKICFEIQFQGDNLLIIRDCQNFRIGKNVMVSQRYKFVFLYCPDLLSSNSPLYLSSIICALNVSYHDIKRKGWFHWVVDKQVIKEYGFSIYMSLLIRSAAGI